MPYEFAHCLEELDENTDADSETAGVDVDGREDQEGKRMVQQQEGLLQLSV